jgi:DivIVA domain-containing protein
MIENIDKITKEILEKKFNKSIHAGYNAEEVDLFFDKVNSYLTQIAQEYKTREEVIASLTIENNKHLSDLDIVLKANDILKAEIATFKKEGYANLE